MSDVKQMLLDELSKVNESVNAELLNALYDMQQSTHYALRRGILAKAEEVIYRQEKELAAAKERIAEIEGRTCGMCARDINTCGRCTYNTRDDEYIYIDGCSKFEPKKWDKQT